MSLWGELKRREVVKVAVAYLVASWLIVQVVGVLTEPLSLPGELDTVVVVLLAIGFPFALVIAWVYEVTPEGIRVTAGSDKSKPEHSGSSQRLTYVVIGLLVISISLLILENFFLSSSSRSIGVAGRLAVLPCDDIGTDPTDSFFALGIHEELLNRFSALDGLRVISRTSVLPYAGNRPPIRQIAEALAADVIMECSIRYSGSNVRLTAQLIDGALDAHIWSDTFPADLSDIASIFDTQADLAMRVARELGVELSLAEVERISTVQTESDAAYLLYLRAANADFDEAIDFLDAAIALDPGFAAAYARKGDRLAVSVINAANSDTIGLSRSERAALAEEAAVSIDQALMLDSGLADAWISRGLLDSFFWRVPEATEAYIRAVELAPNNLSVLSNGALWALAISEFDRALELALRGNSLEPNLPGTKHVLGYTHLARRESDAAVAAYRRATDLDPANVTLNVFLGQAEAQAANTDEAFRVFQLVEELAGENELLLFGPHLIEGYAAIGRAEDAQRLFSAFEQAVGALDIGYAHRARAYLAVGEYERAYEFLGMAVERIEAHEPDEGYFSLIAMKANWFENEALDQPRFRELRDRIGAVN